MCKKYVKNLSPYRLASHQIWSVKPKERDKILKLDWNEATVPPSPRVKERILKLFEEPCFFNLYPNICNEELFSLLSDYSGLPTENIQYFVGSDSLHEYICRVFIGAGDTVLILGPSYDNFRLSCQACGADVVYSNYNSDFTFDENKFESDISRTRPALVYICNPNNPTGNVHQQMYIEHLLNKFSDTLFLIDEAYYEFSGITCKALVTKYENILISRTMSKAFALANFRIGYLIASRDNVQIINRVRNQKNISTIAQAAACGALSDIQYMLRYVDEVHTAMAVFCDALKRYSDKFSFFPSYGNFVLLCFNDYAHKMELLDYLAQNDVFIRDTTQADCVRNCLRVTIGTKEQMRLVSNIIDEFYDKKSQNDK